MGQGESHPVYLLCFIKSSLAILEKLSFIKRQKKGILFKLTHAEEKYLFVYVLHLSHFKRLCLSTKKKENRSIYEHNILYLWIFS